MTLNAEQFGPAQARARTQLPIPYNAAERESMGGTPPVQRQLRVGRALTARPEAHQQTPQQFAADPRSWFHGRYGKGAKITEGRQAKGEGFHAGSKGAAMKRLRDTYGQRAFGKQTFDEKGYPSGAETIPAHLFPMRLTGQTRNKPQTAEPDTSSHRGRLDANPMGVNARGQNVKPGGYFYKNEVEDPGSISVAMPQRKGNLATHRELVQQAQSEGKRVNPVIAAAVKKHPEHTGEDVMAHRHALGRQFDNHQEQIWDPASDPNSYKNNERRVMTTESGSHHVMYRKLGDRQSAMEPKTWQDMGGSRTGVPNTSPELNLAKN